MPPKKPYPLDAVIRHRQQRLEDQALDLASKTRESESSAAQRERREQEREQHAQQVQSTDSSEAHKLQQGTLKVDDLLRLQAYQVAQAEISREHDRHLADAAESERQAHDRQERSRQCLASVRAEAEAIQRHREAFVARALQREEAAVEEQAAEAHSSRHHKGRM